MTRRIAQLIKEQENGSKLFDPRDSDVEAARPLEYPQKTKVLTPEAEEMLTLKDSQQRVVTISKEDKNQNGKKNTETKLTGKKARKLSRKRDKIEKLQKVPEGASQKENLQNLSFAEISEQRHRSLRRGEAI
jgi:hypothetical protein